MIKDVCLGKPWASQCPPKRMSGEEGDEGGVQSQWGLKYESGHLIDGVLSLEGGLDSTPSPFLFKNRHACKVKRI